MIDHTKVLQALPAPKRFCSVDDLNLLVEELRGAPEKFQVRVAGTSAGGRPIHHVRFGKGALKALFVGFPHPNEPIGGLTVFNLLTLLKQGHPELVQADIEWHVVPCIDPDGAVLNEGWTQAPFTIENYVKNSHRPELRDQVDCTFPISYKRLQFDSPSTEANILKELLTQIRPDFYYTLHNTSVGGGVWYALTRPIDRDCYPKLYRLLEQHKLQIRLTRPVGGWSVKFSEGVWHNYTTPMVYDYFEKFSAEPEQLLQHGECSWNYADRLNPRCVTFVTELPYLQHAADGSTVQTDENFRHLRLRLDADNKFLATCLLEEWDRTHGDLDRSSAFYKKVVHGLVSVRESLSEGLPSWPYKTRDVLFNASYNRTITAGERFAAYLEHTSRLCQSYEFVRLLKASEQTTAVREATQRLDALFDRTLRDIGRQIDLTGFRAIDLSSLLRVQLGSGLIVLSSTLQSRAAASLGTALSN